MAETKETYPTIADLMSRWDAMDNAAQRIVNALPHQMTEAAERLDMERLKTRAVLNAFAARVAISLAEKEVPHDPR